jgi:hypothetical protein
MKININIEDQYGDEPSNHPHHTPGHLTRHNPQNLPETARMQVQTNPPQKLRRISASDVSYP